LESVVTLLLKSKKKIKDKHFNPTNIPEEKFASALAMNVGQIAKTLHYCDVCNITTTDEKGFNDHVEGRKHKAKIAKVEQTKNHKSKLKARTRIENSSFNNKAFEAPNPKTAEKAIQNLDFDEILEKTYGTHVKELPDALLAHLNTLLQLLLPGSR
jgi:hypothetical protein